MLNYYLNKVKTKPKVNKKICIIGLGYIGLPTAALLANRGYDIIGVDVNEEVVKIINSGNIHIVEPGLDAFVKASVQSKKLQAYLTPQEADIFIIAVPTPFHKEKDDNGCFIPNIDYVIQAAKSIAPYLREKNIIVLESTSPVGTTEKVKETITSCGVNTDNLFFAHCPERVLPGNILKELVDNDRIVGGLTPEATKITADFYRTFVEGEVLETDAKTAEMVKLVENSFRDVNIAFANELSLLCDKFGISVWDVIKLANRHPRVNILQPGAGVGGHCIAVDPWFIVYDGGNLAKLIRTAREVNLYKTEWVIEKIKNTALKFEIDNKRKPKIACMGLAFKPNIDDLRESPALYITKKLIADNFDILPVEPNIDEYENFSLVDYQTAIEKADIIVFLVAHKEFLSLKIDNKIILDFCGVMRN